MNTESIHKGRKARDNHNVKFIECPEKRCTECENYTNEKCLPIRHWQKQEEYQSRLVIIETEKGYVHLAPIGRNNVEGPPWYSSGWDSAYLGNELQLPSSEIVDLYRVEAYLVYFIRRKRSKIPVHHAIPMLRTPLEHSLIEEVCMEFPSIGRDSPFKRGGLNERLRSGKDIVLEEIAEIIPEMNEETRRRMSNIVAHRKSVLDPLFPLLFDEEIEEIYLSRPSAPFYFDHCRLGRCETDITLSEENVDRFITLLRAESNFHLDHDNPSLKTELKLGNVLLRASATIPPLCPDGLALEIRRARSNPFTIIDLLRNRTLTIDVAAFLVSAVNSRANITITGEPGSGKTTLLNALDMMTPPRWRKLYIEDAIESRLWDNHKQTRFRVPPYDEGEKKLSKTNEIVKCLHRSPDYVILGEIQTAEHSSALFQAIAAGLRTIQTCHSRNSSCLISRWRDSHGISEHEIASMDLIVTVKQEKPGISHRYVAEIAKVQRRKEQGLVIFDGLGILYENNGESECTSLLNVDANGTDLKGNEPIEDKLEVLVEGYLENQTHLFENL